MQDKILVTRSSMPPYEEYIEAIKPLWESHWLPFEDWCYDSSRKTGDTGIVETTYGYHVMYFVGDSQQTYRDYQITAELANTDQAAWSNGIIDAVSVTEGDTKYLSTNIILGEAN